MDSRLRTNDRIKDWIPASAESTPHLEQKGSGGNDGGCGNNRRCGNDGGHGTVGSCTSGATMHVEVMPCSWSW